MEADEIDILARSMLRDIEQVLDAAKAASACEGGREIVQRDRIDRVDLDRAFFHAVPLPHRDPRPVPDADCGRDGTRPHAVAEVFDELHAVRSIASPECNP